MYMYKMPYHCQGIMHNMNALNKSLELIKEAVQGENEDVIFYEYLIKKAPTKEEKEIIESIKNDELKHNKMFRQIYFNITGIEISPNKKDDDFKKPRSYIEGIKKALFGELDAVRKYRKIREGLPSRRYRDMLFEVITDEISHGVKYDYILYLNCCENKKHEHEHEHEHDCCCRSEDFTRCDDYPIYQSFPEDFII